MPLDFVRLPRLLLPAPQVDLHRFAVIACDQFTSEPRYWAQTAHLVGDAPSVLHLMLPEIHLDKADTYLPHIRRATRETVRSGLLRPLPAGLMLVERHTGRASPRRGVLLAFDLEAYDETLGAHAPIRPTEATVAERVPARLAIRADAPIELPHILLFLDDPQRAVLEPLFESAGALPPVYDFPLLQGGGRLTGRLLPRGAQTDAFFARLAAHAARCAGGAAAAPPVFATGDGNHSMAAAKEHWTRVKRGLSPAQRSTHPARWVLAELVNLHDPSICFEPVHRLLRHVVPDDVLRFFAAYPAPPHAVPLTMPCRFAGTTCAAVLPAAPDALPVAAVQRALDAYLACHPRSGIDFIHGTENLLRLADAPGCMGFVLPEFPKRALFPQVVRAGVLPRKTFSMGTALEKRYYLEARPITPEAARAFPFARGLL